MKRRGFLGLLAGAPVAAKAAAGRAAAGLGGSGLSALAPSSYPGAEKAARVGHALSGASDDGWVRRVMLDLAKELASLDTERPEMLRDARTCITRLDPDLADARALSTSARLRLQAERNVAVMVANRRSHIQRRMDELRQEYPLLAALT